MQDKAIHFIQEITTAMNQIDDPDILLDQILNACMQVSNADGGSVLLLDTKRENLEMRATRGIAVDAKNYVQSVNVGVTGWVARMGKSRLVSDSKKEDDYIAVSPGYVSELAIPLVENEIVFGVLSVDARAVDAFNKEHQKILEVLANLVAKIFINLRDTKLLKMRDHFHSIMIKISQIATSSTDLENVFHEIMSITEKAFHMHNSLLLLHNKKEDKLQIEASVGFSSEELAGIDYTPGEGIVGQAFLNKEPVYIRDVTQDPLFLNRLNVVSKKTHISFFCCPIFVAKDPIGVFSTFTHIQPSLSSDHILEFFSIIASFISKAVTIQQLIQEETRVVVHENIKLKQELSSRYKFGNLIGRADVTEKLFEKVQIIAESRATVLLTGESGTGKELFASAIHYNSPRRDAPFIKVNCAAIPENLLESELFGHKKGAFTGAISDKKGKFLSAHEGTIFLDEVGEMDLNLQSKLLRVLQEREIEPVGGGVRKVDIRIIAATNSDLELMIKEKKFREDLYYRLNVISLNIPPLRDRRADIVPLVFYFMEKYNKENNKNLKDISSDAVALLESYDWPGNIRQLQNMIERAIVLSQNNVLGVDDFTEIVNEVALHENASIKVVGDLLPTPQVLNTHEETDLLDIFIKKAVVGYTQADGKKLEEGVYKLTINEVEKRLILLALKKFRYTKIKAAKYLGINRNTLDKKLKELEIEY